MGQKREEEEVVVVLFGSRGNTHWESNQSGHSVRLLGQKKDGGKRLGGARLDLPKIRKNPLIEIISVNTGCLNACTYCKTKHARGDLASYPVEELVERARQSFQGFWQTAPTYPLRIYERGIRLCGDELVHGGGSARCSPAPPRMAPDSLGGVAPDAARGAQKRTGANAASPHRHPAVPLASVTGVSSRFASAVPRRRSDTGTDRLDCLSKVRPVEGRLPVSPCATLQSRTLPVGQP
ncbi:hypothetical protein NHX12_000802 [Muraenolepis orangiensis]|uniref:Radical SAM core domain-containing protein n=1 Tax=Muraenolepis orangiensis TaxID=630683 RepID=A0A9Q0DX33_9TELE|nr:hypothetical protein NHX12_000802 [Muraenolepis orangiensis]